LEEQRVLADSVQRALYQLVQEAASLSSQDFARLLHVLDTLDADIAAPYVALVTGSMEKWLEWERACKDGQGPRSVCIEVERMVRDQEPGIGVVSFFNSRVKTGIVRIYGDLSPGIAVPRWILYYTAFVLRESIVMRLRGLGLVEQVARIPVFIAAMKLVESRARGLLERYRGGVAGATASYLYGEVVGPAAMPALAMEKALGVMPDSSVLRGRLAEAVKGLASLYRDALVRRLVAARSEAERPPSICCKNTLAVK